MESEAGIRNSYNEISQSLDEYIEKARDAKNSSTNHGSALFGITLGVIGTISAYIAINMIKYFSIVAGMLDNELIVSKDLVVIFGTGLLLLYILCVMRPAHIAWKTSKIYAKCLDETLIEQEETIQLLKKMNSDDYRERISRFYEEGKINNSKL